jgi:hypothetical protein|uniref:Uncharacterized protein n=1 Tax=Zea mays TaxID=4577 RepID=A0A804P3W8_MAIZE
MNQNSSTNAKHPHAKLIAANKLKTHPWPALIGRQGERASSIAGPGASARRLRDLDDHGRRGQPRREAVVEQAVAAVGVDSPLLLLLLLLHVEVALVEVERVAERVVPELPDARAAAPPRPLARAAALAEAAAHGGPQPVPQRAQRRRRRRRLHLLDSSCSCSRAEG